MRFAHQVDGKRPETFGVPGSPYVACGAKGRIAGGEVMYCDMNRDHQGPHWDHEDKMWWQHDEPHG